MIQFLLILFKVCHASSPADRYKPYMDLTDDYFPTMYYMTSYNSTYGLEDTTYASFDGRLTTLFNAGMNSTYYTQLYASDLLPYYNY